MFKLPTIIIYFIQMCSWNCETVVVRAWHEIGKGSTQKHAFDEFVLTFPFCIDYLHMFSIQYFILFSHLNYLKQEVSKSVIWTALLFVSLPFTASSFQHVHSALNLSELNVFSVEASARGCVTFSKDDVAFTWISNKCNISCLTQL